MEFPSAKVIYSHSPDEPMIGLNAVPWREDIEEDMVRIWTDSMFSIHQRCGRGPRRRGVKNQKKNKKQKAKEKRDVIDSTIYLSLGRIMPAPRACSGLLSLRQSAA